MTEEHKNKIRDSLRGQVKPLEHRLKISRSMIGHKVSDETKLKMSKSYRNYPLRKHFGYIDMGITSQNIKERNSKKNDLWRLAVFERDNYTCQVCGKMGGYLHADHIKSFSDNPEIRFDVDNGRTICRVCHYYIHYRKAMPSRSKWGMTKLKINDKLY